MENEKIFTWKDKRTVLSYIGFLGVAWVTTLGYFP